MHAEDHATATRGSQTVAPSKPYHLGKKQGVDPEDFPSVRAYLNLPSAIEPAESDQLHNRVGGSRMDQFGIQVCRFGADGTARGNK